ncbi:HNH endonuclease [Streptomyces sp. NPDC018964]|uniref:HNH endonuclease n=1 Tax=unclassified Streptomyces TaxID=2593676 RepID=UPI0037968390
MDTLGLGSWIESAQSALRSNWDTQGLRDFAARETPHTVLGPLGWLLKADINATWARWFIDGFADSAKYEINGDLSYAHLYEEIKDNLASEISDTPDDEVRELARRIAKAAWQEILFRRVIRRDGLSAEEKEELWFSNEPTPRCYLCGYAFSDLAKKKFLGRAAKGLKISPSLVVDFVRPRGRVSADLLPEVDHVRPVAAGGAASVENMRLACGWCNRYKSSHGQLYDVPSKYTARLRHPVLGEVSVPQPLWIIRVVGLRGRCEHREGCDAQVENAELFVAPRRPSGALAPSNCAAYCSEHDPWRDVRFVGTRLLGAT